MYNNEERMEERQNYAFFKKYTKSEYYAKSKKQKFCKIPFCSNYPTYKKYKYTKFN